MSIGILAFGIVVAFLLYIILHDALQDTGKGGKIVFGMPLLMGAITLAFVGTVSYCIAHHENEPILPNVCVDGKMYFNYQKKKYMVLLNDYLEPVPCSC